MNPLMMPLTKLMFLIKSKIFIKVKEFILWSTSVENMQIFLMLVYESFGSCVQMMSRSH